MKDRDKFILWLVYLVAIVIVVIIGYLLIDVNVHIGMISHE